MATKARPKKVPWNATKYRHELKFYINHMEYNALKSSISGVMPMDEYAAKHGGYYHIRSLYFDDFWDSALQQKLDGDNDRRKFRIRIYNYNDRDIKLERKVKTGQFIRKDSTSLSREEFDAIMAGDFDFLAERPEAPCMSLYLEMRNNLMKPKVIVDYVREPFIYPIEEVRVTFDKDLRLAIRNFDGYDIFNPNLMTSPAVDDNLIILEVKFNQFLPAIIHKLIQSPGNMRSSISKYVMCRRYE